MIDDDFKVVVKVMLWLCIMIFIPKLIFDSKEVAMTGIIAISVSIISFINEPKKESFKENYPITHYHIWIFAAYSIVALIRICFMEMEYEEMKDLGRGLFFYLATPACAYFIEKHIKENKGKD